MTSFVAEVTISRWRVPLGGRQAPLLSALVFLLAASQGVLRGQSAAELELSEKKIRPTVSRVSSSCYRALSLKGPTPIARPQLPPIARSR